MSNLNQEKMFKVRFTSLVISLGGKAEDIVFNEDGSTTINNNDVAKKIVNMLGDKMHKNGLSPEEIEYVLSKRVEM